MKNLIVNQILLYGLALFIVTGCGSSNREQKGTTTEGQEATVEVGSFDAVEVKDQIVETIRQMPSEKEVATMLNEAGASYIFDLTVGPDQAGKLLTESEQSLGLGLYSFDLLYSSVYNRGDAAAEISQVSEELIDDLGLRDELLTTNDYLARIRENADNADSLDSQVTEYLNYNHQQLAGSDQPGIYALSVIGSNIEGLYILSQTALLAENNSQMMAIMNQQHDRVNLLFTLLELMSGDEDVKPYYEQFKPVVAIFEENQEITETELKEISSAVEAFRSKILN